MPIPLLSMVIQDGLSTIPFAIPILKTLPWLVLIYILKLFFGGPRNTSERLLHSKVIMITVTHNLTSSLPHRCLLYLHRTAVANAMFRVAHQASAHPSHIPLLLVALSLSS